QVLLDSRIIDKRPSIHTACAVGYQTITLVPKCTLRVTVEVEVSVGLADPRCSIGSRGVPRQAKDFWYVLGARVRVPLPIALVAVVLRSGLGARVGPVRTRHITSPWNLLSRPRLRAERVPHRVVVKG